MPKTSTSPRSNFILVRVEDWEGLYIDGRLVVEGFQLTPIDVLAAIGIRGEVMNCDPEWLAVDNSLPIDLADVKFS